MKKIRQNLIKVTIWEYIIVEKQNIKKIRAEHAHFNINFMQLDDQWFSCHFKSTNSKHDKRRSDAHNIKKYNKYANKQKAKKKKYYKRHLKKIKIQAKWKYRVKVEYYAKLKF